MQISTAHIPPAQHSAGQRSTGLLQIVPPLMADLPTLLDEVAEALQPIDPGYAELLAVDRAEVAGPAESALRGLVAEAESSMTAVTAGGRVLGAAVHPPARPDGAASRFGAWGLFEEIGRDQRRRELPVQNLLSAYQVGGRVAWRHVARIAVQLGLQAEALAALAEALFRLIDELGAATTAGFLDEEVQSAAFREQMRDALAERLLSDRSGQASVEQAAQRAGWPLPERAAVLFLHGDDAPGQAALARMAPAALPLRHTPLPGVIIPDPAAPGRRQRLIDAFRGTTALIGPTVALADLPESARVTEVAARTLGDRLRDRSPVFVSEHLDAVIVNRDGALLRALQEETLRPLDQAAAASRDALRATLRCWLVQMGNRRAVADELGIHPQTVRYRLARLQELFGPALEDPEARLRLLLALGWEVPARRPVPVPVARTERDGDTDGAWSPLRPGRPGQLIR
jgi:DNA-binding PucR family transcriptional regulator